MHNNDAYLNNLLSSCDITWRLIYILTRFDLQYLSDKVRGPDEKVFPSQSISSGKIQLEVNGFIVKELRFNSLLKGKLFSFS